MWRLSVGLSERCCIKWTVCKLNWIEDILCATHSECDPGETSISCEPCYFTISTCYWKWWLSSFEPVSWNLKTHLMDDFYAIFGFRTIKTDLIDAFHEGLGLNTVKNQLFPFYVIWPYHGGWAYVTTSTFIAFIA